MSFSAALLVLVFVLVLFVPGSIVGLTAGLSRWTAVSAAPLVTYGLTAVTEQVCVAVGFSFGPIPLLVVMVFSTAAVLGLVLVTRSRSREHGGRVQISGGSGPPPTRSRQHDVIIVGGIALGALLGAFTALTAMGALDTVNQDWDASFHANATRFILDTGNADPRALSALYPQEQLYYPNTWHALGAVAGQVSGASIPALLGTQTILIAGIAGLGLAALIRASAGRVAVAAVVPLLLASFSGFPIDVLWRGPLLPFAAGVALVPAFLLLFSDALAARRPTFVLVAAIAAAGLLGLHPATALTAAVFALALLISRWLRRPSPIRNDLVVAGSAALLTVLFGLTFLSGALRARGMAAQAQIDWPAVESPGQAIGELLFLNHAAQYPQYWLILLLVAGALGFSRLPNLRWFLAGTAVFGVLFVAAAAYDGPLTESITLPWWNDRWRFVAIVTLGLAVLTAHGLVTLADAAARMARKVPQVRVRPARLVFGAALLVFLAVVGLGSGGFYAPYNADRMSAAFRPSEYLSSAERTAMAYLAEIAQPGERVMNDPRDGSVWMYALTGVEPIFGHVVDPGAATTGLSADAQALLGSFNCLDTDETVQRLIDQYNIAYVFIGQGFLRPWFERAPGLRGLDAVDSLERVYAEDGVRIYEVKPTSRLAETTASPACSAARA